MNPSAFFQSVAGRLRRLTPRQWLAWALRIGLPALLLPRLGQTPAYVTPGPRQMVQTEQPITCVHTRLTDEVEEWKVQRTLQMTREMGATAIVEFFPWAYMEPVEGEYWWGHADMVIDHAEAQGLTVYARMGLVPAWARPDPEEGGQETSLNYLDEEHFDEFAHFVELFAARYAGRVDRLIIWNEPNVAFEWGFQPIDPGRYVRLLEAVEPAARRGNPDVIIVAGALAPTVEPAGSQFGMNDLDYLRGLYEAGMADHYDMLAIHTYGFRFPANEAPAPDLLSHRRAELLRAIMVEYGDGDKPVVISEMGWNDHPRWTKAVRPGQRISYTLDAFSLAVEDWPWAEHMCVWAFRFPTRTYSHPDYFALVDLGFQPRPIYDALQAWARGWPAPEE